MANFSHPNSEFNFFVLLHACPVRGANTLIRILDVRALVDP